MKGKQHGFLGLKQSETVVSCLACFASDIFDSYNSYIGYTRDMVSARKVKVKFIHVKQISRVRTETRTSIAQEDLPVSDYSCFLVAMGSMGAGLADIPKPMVSS